MMGAMDMDVGLCRGGIVSGGGDEDDVGAILLVRGFLWASLRVDIRDIFCKLPQY